MTQIVGNVLDVGLEGASGTMTVWAGFRPEVNALIAPARKTYDIEGGVIPDGVNAVPGPAVIVLDLGVNAYMQARVTIPDQEQVTIQDLFMEAAVWGAWRPYFMREVADTYTRAVAAMESAEEDAAAAAAAEARIGIEHEHIHQDVQHVNQVRTEIEQAYDASEAGQALPPRLTEAALNATYQPVGSYVPSSALASTIRVEKGTLIDNGAARPDWPGIIDWWIPEGGPLPANIASGDLVTEVATEPMPFVPTDIPGLFAWYSAAGAGAADGQTITTLPDLSAGGYPMSAAAGSALYDADGLNGTPALLVNADTQFSTGPIGVVVESGQVLDLFVTGKTNTTSTAQHFVASANEIDIYHLTAATGWQARRNNSGGGANLSAGTSDTNPHIFHFHSDGANSYLSVDGAQVAAGTCGPAGTTELRMFGRTASSNLLDGAIGDVLWVRGGITVEEIDEMHQFLSNRTGIALA